MILIDFYLSHLIRFSLRLVHFHILIRILTIFFTLIYSLYNEGDSNRIFHHLRIILSFLSYDFTVQRNLLLSIFLVNNSFWLLLTTSQESGNYFFYISFLVIRLFKRSIFLSIGLFLTRQFLFRFCLPILSFSFLSHPFDFTKPDFFTSDLFSRILSRQILL